MRNRNKVINDIETKLVKRIPEAKVRSPDACMDEIETLDIVLSLKTTQDCLKASSVRHIVSRSDKPQRHLNSDYHPKH